MEQIYHIFNILKEMLYFLKQRGEIDRHSYRWMTLKYSAFTSIILFFFFNFMHNFRNRPNGSINFKSQGDFKKGTC